MINVIQFLIDNWQEISVKFLALFGAFAAFIKIFPKVEENTILKKILQFIGKLTNKQLD
jgi:hypothetical protein